MIFQGINALGVSGFFKRTKRGGVVGCLFAALLVSPFRLPAQDAALEFNVPAGSAGSVNATGLVDFAPTAEPQQKGSQAQNLPSSAATQTPQATLGWDDGMKVYPTLFFSSDAGGFDAPRTFMVLSDEMEPETFLALSEDLDVMSYLFDKVLGDDAGAVSSLSDRWIERTGRFGSRGTQAIYLEGYGALFLCSVKFPLMAPTAPKETEEATNSVWEDTLREIYGPRERRIQLQNTTNVEPFNVSQVENLQKTLLNLLKHGTNIHLAAGEGITVAVRGGHLPQDNSALFQGGMGGQGASGNAYDAYGKLPGEDPRVQYGYTVDPNTLTARAWAALPTVMTVRVMKSDVDAFAMEKITFDAFRERAKIRAYTNAALPSQREPRERREVGGTKSSPPVSPMNRRVGK